MGARRVRFHALGVCKSMLHVHESWHVIVAGCSGDAWARCEYASCAAQRGVEGCTTNVGMLPVREARLQCCAARGGGCVKEGCSAAQ